MSILRSLFGGALLVNAVPHGVSGVSGHPFPTPFADPPGEGLSSPTLNVVWSALNVAGAVGILRRPRGTRRPVGDVVALAVGALAMAFYLAHHFGRVIAER